jgi:hypothetical protein
VEGIPEEVNPNASLRDRFEQHRANPACAACHSTMDPIGFSLEHFDAVGAWRDEDRGLPIDASAELPDGTTFYGMRELGAVLHDDPAMADCMAEMLASYARLAAIMSTISVIVLTLGNST